MGSQSFFGIPGEAYHMTIMSQQSHHTCCVFMPCHVNPANRNTIPEGHLPLVVDEHVIIFELLSSKQGVKQPEGTSYDWKKKKKKQVDSIGGRSQKPTFFHLILLCCLGTYSLPVIFGRKPLTLTFRLSNIQSCYEWEIQARFVSGTAFGKTHRCIQHCIVYRIYVKFF